MNVMDTVSKVMIALLSTSPNETTLTNQRDSSGSGEQPHVSSRFAMNEKINEKSGAFKHRMRASVTQSSWDRSTSFHAHLKEPIAGVIRKERGEEDGNIESEAKMLRQREPDGQGVDEHMNREYVGFRLPEGVSNLGADDSLRKKWDNERPQYEAVLGKRIEPMEKTKASGMVRTRDHAGEGGRTVKKGGCLKRKREQDGNFNMGDEEGVGNDLGECGEVGGDEREEEKDNEEIFVKFVNSKWTPPKSMNLKEGTLLVGKVKAGTRRILGTVKGGMAICTKCEMPWGHVRWACCAKPIFNHAKYTSSE